MNRFVFLSIVSIDEHAVITDEYIDAMLRQAPELFYYANSDVEDMFDMAMRWEKTNFVKQSTPDEMHLGNAGAYLKLFMLSKCDNAIEQKRQDQYLCLACSSALDAGIGSWENLMLHLGAIPDVTSHLYMHSQDLANASLKWPARDLVSKNNREKLLAHSRRQQNGSGLELKI